MGWRKSSQVKVFCPAFLQKSGRGPGAEPLDARRSARNTPSPKKRRRGSKGGPSPGVPPLRAAPPPAALATPRSRQWTKERVVEDADPYGGWKTDRVPRDLLRGYPTPGRGSAERDKAGDKPTAGRRGRRPLRGGCGAMTPAVIRRRAGVEPRPYRGSAVTVTAGRRGRRPLQGGCAAITPAVIPRRAGVERFPTALCPRASCGRRGRPQRGNPRRGFPL